VESNPPSFIWTVQSNGLDGGVDAEPLAFDGSGSEAPPALVDAGSIDALASDDATTPDLPADAVAVSRDDTAPIVLLDAAALDAESVDLLPFPDVGGAADTKVVATDSASADLLTDAQSSGAEPQPDTAALPEPNPDSASPVVKADAAVPPANKDAATAVDDLKILGGGFCAIAGSRSTSPTPYMIVGLAALALLRRRRK
jgi:uncharacterized protein (TIGR03382 family)